MNVRVRVVDYGLGNLRSVSKGLERAGADVEITDSPAEIDEAEAVVLPGVGAFREGMEELERLRGAVEDAADDTPILGICLGMQMLLTESEEGSESGAVEGLDLIPGRVVRFPDGVGKIPHMGWNSLSIERQHPVVSGVEDGSYVYFVHSYYADAGSGSTVASTEYGVEFSSVVSNERGNVVGTQFHPEKSGEVGLGILKGFVEYSEEY
ncbi:MAG: imidazole glycerol phosphate synthase subunit HisH [Halobacteria archaeon]|nr:imidazole glycerol phosphate synthase subunit HisH [Halobacteria archaeon]